MFIRIAAIFITLSLTNALASDFFQDTSLLFQNRQFSAVEEKCQEKLKTNERSLDAYFS